MSSRPRLPVSNVAHDESEEPTLRRARPAELMESGEQVMTLDDATLVDPSPVSGLRASTSEEELDRFERRETRETLPAPPDADDTSF